ncbi:hypothetical protein ACFLUY_00875 [Chloroflexota bacterium]
MARAVIELSEDINLVMPQMSRVIEGCAYSLGSHTAAFRFENMRVIVERNQITIYGAEDKATVKAVINWLKNIINDTD